MTKNELKILNYFLDEYSTYLSNAGCNDLTLDNTEENLLLLESAHKWNNKDGDFEEDYKCWIKKYKEKDIFGEPILKKIITSDGLIFGYLRHLIKFMKYYEIIDWLNDDKVVGVCTYEELERKVLKGNAFGIYGEIDEEKYKQYILDSEKRWTNPVSLLDKRFDWEVVKTLKLIPYKKPLDF